MESFILRGRSFMAGKEVVSAQECQSLLPAKGALRRKTKLRTYILGISCKKFATFRHQLGAIYS